MARYLVVANQTLGGPALTATIQEHAREGAEIHVVVPATDPTHDKGADPGLSAQEIASKRLEKELARCAEEGIKATGEVGASDPMQAIRDAVHQSRYVGLIIATLPSGVSRWLHLDLPHKAVREFGLSVEWVETRTDDEYAVVHIAVPDAAKKAMRGPNFPTTDVPPLSAELRRHRGH